MLPLVGPNFFINYWTLVGFAFWVSAASVVAKETEHQMNYYLGR